MFHLMLFVVLILFIIALGSILIVGITTMLAGIIGGTVAASHIKNKTVQRILLIAFGLVLSFGSLGVFPIVGLYMGLEAQIISLVSAVILSFDAFLSIGGICVSKAVQNKLGRIVSVILFGVSAAVSALIAVVTFVITHNIA